MKRHGAHLKASCDLTPKVRSCGALGESEQPVYSHSYMLFCGRHEVQYHCSIIQYSTVPYSTAQHITAQYSIPHRQQARWLTYSKQAPTHPSFRVDDDTRHTRLNDFALRSLSVMWALYSACASPVLQEERHKCVGGLTYIPQGFAHSDKIHSLLHKSAQLFHKVRAKNWPCTNGSDLGVSGEVLHGFILTLTARLRGWGKSP